MALVMGIVSAGNERLPQLEAVHIKKHIELIKVFDKNSYTNI